MKVLLIQPPNSYEGKTREAAFFPIGLGHISRAILDDGHDVQVLDIHASQNSREQVAEIIESGSFDVVGISAMSTQYNYVKWLSKIIKTIDANIMIILGWVLSTHSYRIVLENTDVDICVIGEGELTIKELLHNLKCYESIDGIAFKKDGVIVKSNDRKYIQNLDSIPLPAYDLFPMEKYISSINVVGIKRKVRTLNVSIGRGCPYNCAFCSKSFSGMRLRSIDNVIGEIRFLKRKYEIEGTFFTDECLVVKRSRVLELCEKIKSLNMVWSCQGRVNLVDEELLMEMKAAGCRAIGYGVESGSQKILDAMNKKVNVDQARKAILATQKVGLYPIIQMMFGYPGEDYKTLAETVEFFKEVDHPGSELSPTTPLPGTELWRYSLSEGLIGDEERFLSKLDGGYMPDAPVLINYTEFPIDQFDSIRSETEQQIRINYMKRHPFITLAEYIHYFNLHLKNYGPKATLIKVLNKLLKTTIKVSD